MQEKIINPTTGIYAATDDYVHAREVSNSNRLLFISGTMGLDEFGVPPESLEEQLRLVWSNIRQILTEAHMTTDNIMRITSYLRDSRYAEKNQNARLAALGDRRVPTTAIVVETLVSDWLVEIEVIAAA